MESDADIRLSAAASLAFHPASVSEVPLLLAARGDPAMRVRIQAIRSLALVAEPGDPRIIAELSRMVADTNESIAVRVAAATALGGAETGIPLADRPSRESLLLQLEK